RTCPSSGRNGCIVNGILVLVLVCRRFWAARVLSGAGFSWIFQRPFPAVFCHVRYIDGDQGKPAGRGGLRFISIRQGVRRFHFDHADRSVRSRDSYSVRPLRLYAGARYNGMGSAAGNWRCMGWGRFGMLGNVCVGEPSVERGANGIVGDVL
ncbi:MAG: hypothetical protein K0Q94_1345, partial [Paenibacillus sp.]|nr:hypothetical protein [Paenibacillus sp.]